MAGSADRTRSCLSRSGHCRAVARAGRSVEREKELHFSRNDRSPIGAPPGPAEGDAPVRLRIISETTYGSVVVVSSGGGSVVVVSPGTVVVVSPGTVVVVSPGTVVVVSPGTVVVVVVVVFLDR